METLNLDKPLLWPDVPSATEMLITTPKVQVVTWNVTAPLEDLPLDSNFAWLLCALFLAMSWVVYITYYNARIIGFIVTKILNKIYPKGHIKIGSLSISVLSGKIMFRDVAFINEDFTFRTQDGWMIFRWWKPYVEKEISDDLSHCETRLSILLNGVEFHVYNRCQLYSRMEKLFGLEPKVILPGSIHPSVSLAQTSVRTSGEAIVSAGEGETNPEERSKYDWKDLVPVVKIDISTGRIVFGNRLLPTTLSVSFEEAHLVYTSKPASSSLDLFTHICKCTAENFKVLLAPSPKYTGISDEPPRYMGQGFVVLQSNYVDLYYYQDEPGKVSVTPETVKLANGDVVQKSTFPLWGLDIKCGKGTDFSYGPWADRQREQLFKFFFPQEYQTLEVTQEPKIGDIRRPHSFDIRLNTLADSTIDILFSKEKETNAIHMNVGPGSYLEVTIPWLVKEGGYESRICGQLLHLDASTSLQYRALVESETLQFDITVHYPRHWNDHQEWNCVLTGCKATVHLIYTHKTFFQSLIEDWGSKARPDLLRFVPYTWHFSLILKEFELALVTNEHNWIDCSSQLQENAHIVICGELFDLSFDLPFTDFLPQTMQLKFWIQGECVGMSAHLPDANPNKTSVLIMEKCAKLSDRDGIVKPSILESEKRWRNVTTKSSGWVECWAVPIVALSITYTYYPSPPLGHQGYHLDITTPEKEELLLSPIRPNGKANGEDNKANRHSKISVVKESSHSGPPLDFDPTLLPPDCIQVELEVGPSVLKLYGALLCFLIQAKDNYLGECQVFTDFATGATKVDARVGNQKEEKDGNGDGNNEKRFDPRHYRPLDVTVSVTMHDIHGHIMKACHPVDAPCPFLNLERLGFELHKSFRETRLQLLLSPLVICVGNPPETEVTSMTSNCTQSGHVVISALQVRGHAMFSNTGRSLTQETLEYAWLVEVQLGDITGRLTMTQLNHLMSGIETFLFQVQQVDCSLQPTQPFKRCQHDLPQLQCSESFLGSGDNFKNGCAQNGGNSLCPSPDDVKYRMTRFSLDAFDLCLVENNTALELEAGPVRLATCNLHGKDCCTGLSVLIHQFNLHQFVASHSSGLGPSNHSITPTVLDVWLEVGKVNVGPIIIDSALSHLQNEHQAIQDKFLKSHDYKTKRLWCLWPTELNLLPQKLVGKCGCIGGCAFFGANQNGFSFFHVPDSDDRNSGKVAAKFRILSNDDFGFGQSLLHHGEYVFDVQTNTVGTVEHKLPPSSGLQGSFTFTEGYMERSSPKTPDLSPKRHSDSSIGPISPKETLDIEPQGITKNITFVECQKVKRQSNLSASRDEIGVGGHDVRKVVRQFSSPGHGGTSISSIVQVGPLIPSVSLVSASTDTNSSESQLTRKGSSHSDSEKKEQTGNAKTSGELSSPIAQRQRGSRRSLNGLIAEAPGLSARGMSPRSVRRAISTESTHSSEAYFSADEESLSSALAEEGSSSYPDTSERSRFLIPKVGNGSLDRKTLPTNKRQSLQDIDEQPGVCNQNTLESNSSSTSSGSSTAQYTPPKGAHDTSEESNSVSSTSFISAVSSQEDVALVDLHNQMDKAIVESPVLMSCYNAYMTQVQCQQWNAPPPLPHLTHQEASGPNGSPNKDHLFHKTSTRWKPKFIPLNEGFTCIRIVEKPKQSSGHPYGCHWNQRAPTSQARTDDDFVPGALQHSYKTKNDGKDSDCGTDDFTVYRNTFVVKVKGDINIMISPLMLEALRSFVEAITPTMAILHPLTVVNHLHSLCTQQVVHQNQLKKEKVLYLCQLQQSQHWEKSTRTRKEERKSITSNSDSIGSTTNYEEVRTDHLQAFLDIQAVNVCIMQAAIVEEIIAFSALDNVKDLTCASLLAFRVDHIFMQASHKNQTRRALQTFAQHNAEVKQNLAKTAGRSTKKGKSDFSPTELVTVELKNDNEGETAFSANVSSIHVQLRRLRNSSSILREAILTVIPIQRSRACFTFEKIMSVRHPVTNRMSSENGDTFPDQDWDGRSEDSDKTGFIMFECGFEDLSFKFVNSKQKPLSICHVKTNTAYNGNGNTNQEKFENGAHNQKDKKKGSFPSEGSDCGSPSPLGSTEALKEINPFGGDASSAVFEIKTVWLNFAAPPKTPNTRKIDFTRLDWHLLSTATPSINAWLKAGNRFQVAIQSYIKLSNRRACAILGCLMADALDRQEIHMPVKSKFLSPKLTPLAKTLQEDPSCQLLMVLKRYLEVTQLESIEENLNPDCIPPIQSVRRGIVALGRQWKNILYMPLLMEQNYRLQKNLPPYSMSFIAPPNPLVRTSSDECEKVSLDECEVTDETTNLLMAEGGSIFVHPGSRAMNNGQENSGVKSSSTPDVVGSVDGHRDLIGEEGLSTLPARGKRKLPSYPPRSSRASVAFPLLGGPLDSPARYTSAISKVSGFILPHYTHSLRVKKMESHHSLKSTTWSLSSIEPNIPSSILETPRRDEDLYNWMARQQDNIKGSSYDVHALQNQIDEDSRNNTLGSNQDTDVKNESNNMLHLGLVPMALQPVDAHIIFRPLFSHLGISDGLAFSVSKTFGSKISVCSIVEILKVDIVESEYYQNTSTGRHKKKAGKKQQTGPVPGKLYMDTSMDTPAFICNKFSLDMDFTQRLDPDSFKLDPISQQSPNFADPNATMYTTMVINFTINAHYIAQQVNMPVLRLIHQFASMYANVIETRLELKSKRPRSFKDSVKDRLKKSPSATESHAESSRPQSPKVQTPSKISAPVQITTKSFSGGVANLTAGIKRTHSLSQKLRTTCNLRGYTNLQDANSKCERPYSPLSLALSESVAIDMPDSTPTNAGTTENIAETVPDGTTHCSISEDEILKEFHPHCWKTMYHLLDLYEFRPETKTVKNRFDVKPLDISESYNGNGKYEPLKEHRIDVTDFGKVQDFGKTSDSFKKHPLLSLSKGQMRGITKNLLTHDRTPLIVFGVMRMRRVKLLATLSGLKLEGELNGLNGSLTVKERMRGSSRKWSESSLTGQLGQTIVSVLEGVPPNQGVVVKMSIGKSQTLYSSLSKGGKVHNSGLLTIGPVEIDIPQHPVALHGMMTRSSRQLSTTLQELRSSRQSSRSSRQLEDPTVPLYDHLSPQPHHFTSQRLSAGSKHQLISPIVIQFSIILDSLTIGAALLPSLKAQYKMGQVTSMGITGSKAKFTVDLPKHSLSFNTKVPTDANLPSSASVDLPPVHISAEYIQDPASTTGHPNQTTNGHSNPPGPGNSPFGKVDSFTDGVVLRQGSYLSALAEIGSFEHCLTTDLLNHLVLVQKVFMKEVNEVLQKMYGGDKLVPLWNEEKTSSLVTQRLLFSVQLRLKGIQITATTPTSSAVRLETGVVELQLSNRVQNMSIGGAIGSNYMKLFGKAQVDINLSLGQLLKNALFEEAEPEFQQFAYFKTRICMRNALQDEMISSQSEDKEAVLITLNRPLIYLQPVALDKAVLVWLNYKNAYEFWNEQRSILNKEELLATQQILERVPQISQLGAQSLGTLFLQLTVNDMGICLPLSHPTGKMGSNKTYDTELKAAVVVTLESTRVSACSCRSLVSKARFTGLCIRFADDFETSLDDWKPDPMDSSIMNLCVVSEGTYEICSQTLAPQPHIRPPTNAKWILNVQWQMEGVDIHVDTNIGKQLSALFKTLTALTGEEDEGTGSGEGDESGADMTSGGLLDIENFDGHDSLNRKTSDNGHLFETGGDLLLRKGSLYVDGLQGYVIDPNLEAKKRSRLIEKEMNEQAKIINDLRLLGASQSTIETEMRRLQELEAAVFNDFRRDVIKKLRRQSVKATSFKDKLGLGSRTSGSNIQSHSLFFPDVVHERSHLTDIEQGASSQESSPSHNHTRTGSLDIGDINNLTPDDKPSVHRELSLDSVFMPGVHSGRGEVETNYSETSTPSHGLDNSPCTVIPKMGLSAPPGDTVPTSPSTVSSSEADQDFPPVVLRNKNEWNANGTGFGSFLRPPATLEPSIDFELDVKVFFNSGKCVFHTKDSFKEDDQNSRKSMKKERSFSGGFDVSSPSHSSKRRHGSGLKLNASSTKLRNLQMPLAGQIADFTIFLIPGLDIKVHYNSKTVTGESPMNSSSNSLKPSQSLDDQFMGTAGLAGIQQPFNNLDSIPHTGVTLGKKTQGVKKASLFAWMTLQSIPEEAVVSPHILDFLEQALEPIPLQMNKPAPLQVPAPSTTETNIGAASAMVGATSQYAAYASFPVDVIVYFRMQPSIVRFSCLPVSRVECLLRLPSVDLVFSSKRATDELCPPPPVLLPPKMSQGGNSSPPPQPPPPPIFENIGKHRGSFGKENSRATLEEINLATLHSGAGGLSMTGCLADFSLYIFHPYGGAKKSGSSGASSNSSMDGEASPLTTSERKDSLSLQVEFVKVNISRSRKMALESGGPSFSSWTSPLGKGSKSNESGSSTTFITTPGGAVIRFSAVCDIGSASFKYDMRRLTEILAFPKAWYRRSIARRMFLGDQSIGALYSDQDDSLETSSSSGTLSPSISKPSDYFLSSTPHTTSSDPSSGTPGAQFSVSALDNSLGTLPDLLASSNSSTTTTTTNSSAGSSTTSSNSGSNEEGSLRQNASQVHPSSIPTRMGFGNIPSAGLREGLRLSFRESPTKHNVSKSFTELLRQGGEGALGGIAASDSPVHNQSKGSAWETLVLFAVSLSRLNVQMNMGNVMGNTSWLTRDFKSQGRLSIGSSGHKNLFVSVGLDGSSLDSKGGIVGGTIELSCIETYMHLREDYGQKPDHKIALQLAALESRLDYMGTSVLMGRVSSLDITLHDEWQVASLLSGSNHHHHHHRRNKSFSDEESEDSYYKHPTKRPALIFMHGVLGWDQLQLLISKSTTTDLMKMYTKLEEFFSQQFHSSKRVFSSLQPGKFQHHRSIKRPQRQKSNEGLKASAGLPESEARHHRHWQKVLSFASGMQTATLPHPLPTHGTILGGTMALHGNNISLACFHGINFRSKSWAIFSLREPNISFATEAQDVLENGSVNTHIVQNLSFGLGQSPTEHAQHTSMATVCKISRNVLFPPQFRTMHEWFHYAFSTSELDDVGRFPVLEHERDSLSFMATHDRRASVSLKGPEFNHTMEIIFALPSLQFHLKTEHFQSGKTPTLSDTKPTVECSFVTEFDDHIFVSVDAEAFFFLHDLITSYIKEKDNSYIKTQSPDSDWKRKVADPTEALQKDWRDYVCHTWHLEPTVRLLSWAGKGIEPYGVDYILQKLGFAHARVTIPKWTQRGCMDPLDKILSVVMERLICAVKEDKELQATAMTPTPNTKSFMK